MKSWIRVVVLAALAATAVSFGVLSAVGSTTGFGTQNRVLEEALAVEQGLQAPRPHRPSVSGGVIYTALDFSGVLDQRANGKATRSSNLRGKAHTQGCQNRFPGNKSVPGNVRVNQDCSLRRQAEEVIAVDPNDRNHLIAGQNDSRLGFNHCGYDWSFDGGKTWGDQVPPFFQFILADGHTADACSDPTATFDSQGNAYVGGVLFDINSNASAFVVAKSNAQFGGTFYHSPDSTLSFQEYRDVPLGVVASDADDCIFHDKEYIVADARPASPKHDNVYATWTRFTCENSPIYFSQSTDGGATWSPGIAISGNNPDICTDFSVVAGDCDQDQGSHPIVGADGSIYVAFGNGNTPELGVNQVLFVKCPAAADCTDPASWSAPVKVNDLIGTHPIGDPGNAGGCPVGRQCLPPNGYRVPEFTSITTSVTDSGTLFVSWADFRNGDDPGSTCGPLLLWSEATPPCDNDVFYSYSTDGGATWSTETKVTPAGSAQWQPWSAVAHDGSKYFVAYYDRSYGDCEFTGCNDITMATVTNAATPSPSIKYLRITTSSMPNLTPVTNPIQAGFLGDYMWVTVDRGDRPRLVWADTRGLGGTVEEDIYTARTIPK